MYRVGLTGGIASGKSEVALEFSRLGAHVVDHDVLARQAGSVGSRGLERIKETFGSEVLTANGELNRPALGQIVFSNPAALDALNAIVHPEVKRLALEADLTLSETTKFVIHDIPLLVETTQSPDFDAVVVVEAPIEQRIERMVKYRGMTAQDAQARISAQASDAQRREIATHIIRNDSTIEALQAQVQAIYEAMELADSTNVVPED